MKQYIESGVLELFVLDMLDANVQKEVLENIKLFPEIKAEVLAIQEALERYARVHNIPPDDEVCRKIFGDE